MKLKWVIGLVLVLVLLAGCTTQTTPEKSAPETKEEPIVIGFSMSTLQEERWIRDRDFFLAKAAELGATVEVAASENNAELQNKQIENMILEGVDVLVIAPYDADKVAPMIEKAHQAGIKVISYDRLIRNADIDLYLSFDNEKVGELEAQGVLGKVSKGKFAYIGGSTTDNNALLLKKGSMKLLQPKIDSGDIQIVVDKFTPDWKPEEAYKNLKEYLATGGKVDAVVAANDGTAGGSIKALEEVGLAGKIPVSGQDAELAACQRVVKGTQTVTVYKSLKLLASRAAELAVQYAKKETVTPNANVNNGLKDVPSVLLEPVLVTKENMMSTVIKENFQKYEDVYSVIPESERPPKQ